MLFCYWNSCTKPGKQLVLYSSVRGIYFVSFQDFSIGFWKYSDSIVFFFYFIDHHLWLLSIAHKISFEFKYWFIEKWNKNYHGLFDKTILNYLPPTEYVGWPLYEGLLCTTLKALPVWLWTDVDGNDCCCAFGYDELKDVS